MKYAGVRLLDLPSSADREYTYTVPDRAEEGMRPGRFVTVPFGRGDRKATGICVSVSDVPPATRGLKPVSGLLDERVSFDAKRLAVAEYLRSTTLCPFGDAVRAMIPSAALGETNGTIRICSLTGRFSPDELSALSSGGSVRTEDGKISIRSEGQRAAVAKLLAEGGKLPVSRFLAEGVTAENLSALRKKGIAEISDEASAVVFGKRERFIPEDDGITLNEEQREAIDRLSPMLGSGRPCGALLEGVTGSGKTVVMLRLIDRCLAAGRGVILLIPEISLTPQTLSIFCARYKDRVAVLHSGLSGKERAAAYLRICEGAADLVIGTRSAVFAPVADLGMIIIDEEQEHTYKSDSSPRYHARDVAGFRCAKENAFMLLASATPSLESRYRAAEGKITLVRLNGRYGNSVLPRVTVADMRLESTAGNLTPIGSLLAGKLKETYSRGEQSVLFLNRRGYNNYISCASCGEAVGCPQCSVSMTYHTKGKRYDEGFLVCHWCGRRMRVPEKCPSCASPHLIRMGYGTQRVEEELEKLLPGARIMRMDTDSTRSREAYSDMLGRFRRREADVLLGTQMVTKGHDFPGVTLVGVLLADASLYYDDYRAAERTFALLTQVIGRAGRRDTPGEAVIQTNNPDHEIIRLAGKQDYEAMYAKEIKLRHALVFPPFCDIALFTVSSEKEKSAVEGAAKLTEAITAAAKEHPGLPFRIFGPFEAPVYLVGGRYRMRTVVKCVLNRETRAIFAGISEAGNGLPGDAQLSADFNPASL